MHNPDFAAHSIGEWTYGVPTVQWYKPGRKLTIGRFCSIGPHVTIMLGGNHRTDWVTTFPFAELLGDGEQLPRHETTKGDVSIGHDVWIGQEALILSGISIGSGAVVGARSVVTKNVAPYSVVVGNPARHVRYRVPESLIDELLRIAWWDWPLTEIKAARSSLLSPRIERFVTTFGRRHRPFPALRETASTSKE